MFTCILLTAFLLQGDAPTSADDTAGVVKEMLARKGTEFPYWAEYDLALPAQPRAAAGKRKLRVFAPSKDALYSSDESEHWHSRILLKGGRLYWEYHDETVGTLLFEAPAPLKDDPPEAFLQSRELVTNTFTAFDQDFLEVIEEILRKVSRQSVRDGVTTVMASTKALGAVQVTLEPSELNIDSISRGKTSARLLHYAYATKAPSWARDVDRLVRQFKKDPEPMKVRRLKDDFTYNSVFDELHRDHGRQEIALAELKGIARRLGYLLPDTKECTIVSAKGIKADIPARELALEIQREGRTYAIVQYATAMSRKALPANFVKGERTVGRYNVLSIVDLGTGGHSVYYLADGVSLIAPGKHFDDKILDQLVLSFAKVEDPPSSRGAPADVDP